MSSVNSGPRFLISDLTVCAFADGVDSIPRLLRHVDHGVCRLGTSVRRPALPAGSLRLFLPDSNSSSLPFSGSNFRTACH
jgi:hypothetical protein